MQTSTRDKDIISYQQNKHNNLNQRRNKHNKHTGDLNQTSTFPIKINRSFVPVLFLQVTVAMPQEHSLQVAMIAVNPQWCLEVWATQIFKPMIINGIQYSEFSVISINLVIVLTHQTKGRISNNCQEVIYYHFNRMFDL